MIQNQTGNDPTKWDKTGIVLENRPHSQVLVRVDGSRRITLRNRRFVKKLHSGLTSRPHQPPVRHQPVQKTPPQKRTPEPIPNAPEPQQEPPVIEVPRAPLVTPGVQDCREEIHDVPEMNKFTKRIQWRKPLNMDVYTKQVRSLDSSGSSARAASA